MSQNRAVQAAQRRRAGGPEPAAPGRGPQPSINSSQLFSQGQQGQQGQGQMRPGTNGRLAGQQAQLQQQQMQQQMKQQMSEPRDQGLASVNRMTLAQAITLITLRLGKVETHLQEHDNSQMSGSGLDSGIIDVIMSRLDALESQGLSQSPVTNSNVNVTSSLEVTALKQNVDVLKTAISQSKSSLAVLTNEHKALKQEVESLKAELASLQGLTMENNQQLMKLSLAVDLDGDADLNLEEDELEELSNDNNDNTLDNDDNEIVGTNLKDLIEKELKL
jgi:hypothetical protein